MKHEMTFDEYLTCLLAAETTEDCPVLRALGLLNGKWRAQVIYQLCRKPSCRFGELKKSLPPITNTMLTSCLRDLTGLGIVKREQFNEIPPHVEYSLTEKGRALLPVVYELYKWAQNYLT